MRVRPAWAALGAACLGLIAIVAFDRWYAHALVARERDRVQALAAPYTQQVTGFFDRRLSRLDALRAFVEAEPALPSLDANFPTFAEGLSAAAPGVRAFQLVRNARIMRSWPMLQDSLLVGLNLLRSPDPAVVHGVRRAMASDSLIVTGPVSLLQGGAGVIVQQRLRPFGPEGPDMVTIVLDLDAIKQEAGLDGMPLFLAYSLTDERGRAIMSRGIPRLATVSSVRIATARWTLHVAPAAGWESRVGAELRLTRAASALLWLMLVYITATVAGRQRTLSEAVSTRTRELAAANDELRREVAERQALEEQLLHSQKMEAVGTLAGGIAHDFNNLLTAITGFAQLSEQHTLTIQALAPAEHGTSFEELRTDIAEILKAADRASLLTSQLLAFSRQRKVTPDRNDLNGVVLQVECMLQRLIGERVTLITTISETPLPVMGDAGQLSQLVMNLVVNARDALPDGGAVRVSTDCLVVAAGSEPPLAGVPTGEWARLRVEDNGIGMTADVMSRIFEPFFTTKHMGGGTGLGLSMVYGIVTQAGGHVFVDSREGRGTVVSVLLPRLDLAPDDSRSAVVHRAAGERELILVVEDEAGLRRLVGEILRRKGFRVLVAADGCDALQLLDTHPERPALLLTDVVMPRMGGRELAAAVHERQLPLRVLFMSGYHDGEEMPDAPHYSYIAKPFTPDALVEKVRRALRGG